MISQLVLTTIKSKNDEFFENYKDNDVVMDLVERLHNSTTYEEEEIAEELWEECGYDNAARMLDPDGRLEVTYKKSDEEDINERSYEILDSDWIDFDDFFEKDIKEVPFALSETPFQNDLTSI